MNSAHTHSKLRTLGAKLASFSILLIPAVLCGTLIIIAISKGPTTWLVWPFAIFSLTVCLWILRMLLPDRYSYFADTLKSEPGDKFVVSRVDET